MKLKHSYWCKVIGIRKANGMLSIILKIQNFNLDYKENIFIRNIFPLNCWLTYFLTSLEGAAFLLVAEGEMIKLVESAKKCNSMVSANCPLIDSFEIRQLFAFCFKVLHCHLYFTKLLPGEAPESSIISLQTSLKQSAMMAALKCSMLRDSVTGNTRIALENCSHFLWYQFSPSELVSFRTLRACICTAC